MGSSATLPSEAAASLAADIETCRILGGLTRRDDLDQCFATAETVLRRLELLLSLGALDSRQLLLLGDDDLLSLAISRTGRGAGISVVDYDQKILASIRRCAGNGIQLVHADLRASLPDDLIGKFDTVFTDPPYTLRGQLLFAHRALLAAKKQGNAGIFLCASRVYLPESRIGEIVSFLARGGFSLEQRFPDFNEYPAPPDVKKDMIMMGVAHHPKVFRSDLFYFKRTKPAPIPSLVDFDARRIYDYEESHD